MKSGAWFTEEHADYVRFQMKVREHLFSGKSKYQKIDVYDTYEFGIVLVIDDFVMLTEKDEFIYHEMITHVAMAANPSIKDVLIIGGGDGGTARELAKYSSIQKVDLVDIDGLVIDVSKEYLPFTGCGFDDERVNVFVGDGLEYVKMTNNKYDLIIIDSTDNFGPGESLFTQTFYENCNNILRKEGVLVNQHECPFYDEEIAVMQQTHNKLHATFKYATVFQAHIPTYASGHWLFGFASNEINPDNFSNLEEWNNLGIKTNYYNTGIHYGSFQLPNYVIKSLLEARK